MSELKFDMSKTDNVTYVDYNSVNGYEFVSHVYNGTGGIKDGSYLIPFDRELFYNKRRTLASFRNYLKPIVDSAVKPVFNRPIVRISNNDIFDAFLTDVDNKQNDMTTNSRDVCLLARLHGVVFVVMDNFAYETIPLTTKEVINTRRYPYVYTQPAYTVKRYKTDQFNKILSITFIGKDEMGPDNKVLKTQITWDSNTTTKEWLDGDKVVNSITTIHDLGQTPVVALYSDTCDDVLPMPPYYDLAKLNVSLFNKDSELRDQERSQAFSVFYMQADTSAPAIAIGPHSAVILPLDPTLTITPGYASPDSSILTTLITSGDKFIESMYQMASNNGVVGLKSASSGIAEAYKFVAKNDQLKQTAAIGTRYELALSRLFALYIKTPIEYTVSYTTNFDTFYTQSSVDDVTKLLNMNLPNDIKKEIKKATVSRFLDNLNYERIDELHDVIDNETVNTSDNL